MTNPTPLRAATVSRFLGRNTKLERSQTYTTRIRGWHTWTEGFEVRGMRDGSVQVDFVSASSTHRTPEECRKVRDEAMETMRKALGERYTVTPGFVGMDRNVILVTAK